MSKVALIIETREHEALPFVIDSVMNQLDDDWKLQIFHGTGNANYVKRITNRKYFDRTITTNLGFDSLPQWPESNDLMVTEALWEQCEGDTILYFEADSMICPNSNYKISDFEHFDYIGGYWGNTEYPLDTEYPVVMNGGLSIRKKQFMLDIINNNLESYLKNGGNPCEDYFVSSQVKNKPTSREVRNFSIDCGYISPLDMKAPFAVHKPWGVTPSKGHGRYYEDLKKVCKEVEELKSLQEEIKWWGK